MPFDGANYKTNTVADVLRRAKALIDSPEKWGGGDGGECWHGEADKQCIAMAVSKIADPGMEADNPIWVTAFAAMRRALGVYSNSAMYRWNDAPERTHAEVLQAFDAAIAIAEAEG